MADLSKQKKTLKKTVNSLEALQLELKKLIQDALANGTSKQDILKQAQDLINEFLAYNKTLKGRYTNLYQDFKTSLYANFTQMYAIAHKQFIKSIKKDKTSQEIYKSLQAHYNEKKYSYVLKSNTDISSVEPAESPSLKFIRTSGEYGYDQMQIDNYVDKVEEQMNKLMRNQFVTVNSNGARVNLRNKAEMEVRYQDMQDDLKSLKNQEFVVVSQHKDASLRCACWQGLIYLNDVKGETVSMLNWREWNSPSNHITPTQLGLTPDGQPYYSLKEAMQHGLFGYNCRHRLIKYEPHTKYPKQYAYNPDEESQSSLIDKKMRQYESQIRMCKERSLTGLTVEKRKEWRAKSKALQREYIKYATVNHRVRDDWRTSIGEVERQEMQELNNKGATYIAPKTK